jgi:uncharacterized membrane protein
MTYDLAAWLNLALRWLHVVAGVCWIGASFYFVWLDNSLRPTNPPTPGVKGDLWAVHGGGFYHKRKFTAAPPELPEHLHWFKWEAYTTWISGFLLLCVLYYWGAPVYLIDKAKIAFTPLQAVGVGASSILGGWLVYETLCRSPLASFPRLFAALWFLAVTAAAVVLTRIFSDRGAFIHVGAIIGTVMAANVLVVIIPGQRKAVAAMIAGQPVDPRYGATAKLRSVHNNYMTLPVIFIMISNHYPIVVGHPLNWLLLSLISAGGISIRHYFMRRHFGANPHGYLFAGGMLVAIASVVATEVHSKTTLGPAASLATPAASFAMVEAVVETHCIACHSRHPTHTGFSAPPNGAAFDTPEDIKKYAPRMFDMAVASHAMPLGNETGMTDADRAALGAWIKAGADTR